ncbi:MAG: hypothetical protein ACYCSO_06730 [Cuniculiplasma sp.]
MNIYIEIVVIILFLSIVIFCLKGAMEGPGDAYNKNKKNDKYIPHQPGLKKI